MDDTNSDLDKTYERNAQYTASVERLEDAKALQQAGRWSGAIYLGGYAIECSLKSLICYSKGKNVITDLISRDNLHNLGHLLTYNPEELQELIRQDRSGKFNPARETVIRLWRKDELRYGTVTSHQHDCKNFMDAVELLHYNIIRRLDSRYRRKHHGRTSSRITTKNSRAN